MGSDFSALDAELDQVGSGPEGPEVDALALASQYAGDLVELAAVDTALAELGAKVEPIEASAYARDLPVHPSIPSEAPPRAEAASDAPARGQASSEVAANSRAHRLESEEIELPSPVVREPEAADKSGELALDAPAPRSGSFALDDASEGTFPAHARDRTLDADDFVEPVDDELSAARPESEPLGNGARSLFDSSSPAEAVPADQRAQAAFSALFEEATRPSDLPAVAALHDESLDDTEIFDSAAFAERLEEDEESMVEAFTAEELDSAEFDVLADTQVEPARPPSAAAPARSSSKPPEKRPSFLGRLFGRKDE